MRARRGFETDRTRRMERGSGRRASAAPSFSSPSAVPDSSPTLAAAAGRGPLQPVRHRPCKTTGAPPRLRCTPPTPNSTTGSSAWTRTTNLTSPQCCLEDSQIRQSSLSSVVVEVT